MKNYKFSKYPWHDRTPLSTEPADFFCKLLDYVYVRRPDTSLINALQDSNNVAILLKHAIDSEAKTTSSERSFFCFCTFLIKYLIDS